MDAMDLSLDEQAIGFVSDLLTTVRAVEPNISPTPSTEPDDSETTHHYLADFERKRHLITDERSSSCPVFYIVVDTNVLLTHLHILEAIVQVPLNVELEPVLVIPWVVVRELDYLKNNHQSTEIVGGVEMTIASLSRRATRWIQHYLALHAPGLKGQPVQETTIAVPGIPAHRMNDDSILHCALTYHLGLMTSYYGLAVDHDPLRPFKVLVLSNDRSLSVKCLMNGCMAEPASALDGDLDHTLSAFHNANWPEFLGVPLQATAPPHATQHEEAAMTEERLEYTQATLAEQPIIEDRGTLSLLEPQLDYAPRLDTQSDREEAQEVGSDGNPLLRLGAASVTTNPVTHHQPVRPRNRLRRSFVDHQGTHPNGSQHSLEYHQHQQQPQQQNHQYVQHPHRSRRRLQRGESQTAPPHKDELLGASSSVPRRKQFCNCSLLPDLHFQHSSDTDVILFDGTPWHPSNP
eukprot:m.103346 g.103346  ORF g.103346 m.103346 type:complete len:462 (+) comp13234_c2_seq2:102-1487(+)